MLDTVVQNQSYMLELRDDFDLDSTIGIYFSIEDRNKQNK
jgi:hypothetical protein